MQKFVKTFASDFAYPVRSTLLTAFRQKLDGLRRASSADRTALQQPASPRTDASWPTLCNPHFQRRAHGFTELKARSPSCPGADQWVTRFKTRHPPSPVASFQRLGVLFPLRRFDVRALNIPVASWSRFFDVAAASAFSLGQARFYASPPEKTLASPARDVLDQQALFTRLPRLTVSPP